MPENHPSPKLRLPNEHCTLQRSFNATFTHSSSRKAERHSTYSSKRIVSDYVARLMRRVGQVTRSVGATRKVASQWAGSECLSANRGYVTRVKKFHFHLGKRFPRRTHLTNVPSTSSYLVYRRGSTSARWSPCPRSSTPTVQVRPL